LETGGLGEWHLRMTQASGAPAVANYVRRPGDLEFRALSIDVMRINAGRIIAMHCVLGDTLFPAFNLALSFPGPGDC
jgi:hypothetical protein